MNLRNRIEKLEQTQDRPSDLVNILLTARNAHRNGTRTPSPPLPPEWEHSKDPLKRKLFSARRRVGP
jgi:hypothetical protein